MEDKKVCEGNGIIETKTESVTKKGDKFWKFKVNGLTYSLFEYEAGRAVEVNDKVKLFWTETQGAGSFGAVTYRNLNSIFKEADGAKGAVGSALSASETDVNYLRDIAIELKEMKEIMKTRMK